MYFKSMELAGFKSFADRREIKLNEGITAIVGPNGCGKSNIADAIRWVLGEQSSKQLRGSSMQDVIFSGTEKRKSLSYCEVTLIFDNSDRYLKYDNDEIAITRKLYRSGESEYLINRMNVRLKDILDLLYDSGIGRDGYSIIGQGQVTEIMSAKPEDRRAIFEDAAGIAKFKSRKLESERKLERAKENLDRLNIVIVELENQIGPMKKQAENAKKCFEFKSELKDLEVNAYIYQYDNAKEVKDRINTKLMAISSELALREEDLLKASNDYDSSMEKLTNIDADIDKVHNEITKLSVELEKQSGEVRIIRERINSMNAQKDKIGLDILNANNVRERDKLEFEYKKAKQDELNQEISALNLSYDEISNNYLKVIDELNDNETETESSKQKMLDAMDKLSDIKSNASRFEAERKMLEENVVDTISKMEIVDKTIADKQTILKNIEDNCLKLQDEKTKKSNDYSNAKFKQDTFASNLRDEENERHNLSARLQVFENKKRLLSEMQESYEGYAYAVKRILKDSEKNSALKNKMVGVLASLITVPEKFETATEVALGNAVQNIVTFNENNAKDLISYLKTNQLGRATFLPISKMQPKRVSFEDQKILSTNGCFGIASELISYPSDIDNVISNLLGSTVFVDTLDTAIAISNNTKFSYKIVTLDGDVINPQGSMTGGSRKAEASNLISREREIQTLSSEIEKMKESLLNKTKEIESLQKENEFIKQNITVFLDNKNEAEVSLAKELERLENIKSIIESERKDYENYLLSKKQFENRIDFITSQLNSIDELENNAVVSKNDANKYISEKQQKFNALKEKREEFNLQMNKVKLEIMNKETKLEGIKQDFERIEISIERNNNSIIAYEKEIVNLEKTIDEAENIISEKLEKDASLESKNKLNEVKTRQLLLEQSKQTTQNTIKTLDIKKSDLMKEISRINDKKFHEEMSLSKVDTDIESMQERIFEEYQLTYSSCQEYKRPDFNIENAMPTINNLKKEIAKLGYVNFNAIEDIKGLMERYEFTKAEYDDTLQAIEQLNQAIEEVSVEMRSRFSTQFNKINENFKVTFKELFGGGNARLELVDSDDILEAGIDIFAEPPGKKLQRISLLSGGEKSLTAIAILFSILKLRPMPFCLLDEIEAALDDANVDRFAQYLHRFSEKTQFIVITHRKPTMELADGLFGVTMQEKGVSTIVSVKLSDAVKTISEEN